MKQYALMTFVVARRYAVAERKSAGGGHHGGKKRFNTRRNKDKGRVFLKRIFPSAGCRKGNRYVRESTRNERGVVC